MPWLRSVVVSTAPGTGSLKLGQQPGNLGLRRRDRVRLGGEHRIGAAALGIVTAMVEQADRAFEFLHRGKQRLRSGARQALERVPQRLARGRVAAADVRRALR